MAIIELSKEGKRFKFKEVFPKSVKDCIGLIAKSDHPNDANLPLLVIKREAVIETEKLPNWSNRFWVTDLEGGPEFLCEFSTPCDQLKFFDLDLG